MPSGNPGSLRAYLGLYRNSYEVTDKVPLGSDILWSGLHTISHGKKTMNGGMTCCADTMQENPGAALLHPPEISLNHPATESYLTAEPITHHYGSSVVLYCRPFHKLMLATNNDDRRIQQQVSCAV